MAPPSFLLLFLLLVVSIVAAPSCARGAATTTTARALWPQEPWPTPSDVDAAVARLSRALTFETVSVAPGNGSGGSGGGGAPAPEMRALHAHLERSYPAIFGGGGGAAGTGGLASWWPVGKRSGAAAAPPRADAGAGAPAAVTVERLGCGRLSLLIAVRGAEPSLRPVLLVGHLDVVAAAPDAAGAWAHPPFGGAVAAGSAWGRGAVDAKGPALALLEALSALLQQRGAKGEAGREPWRPRRTVLVALGHDEEVGGACGARRVAEHLRATAAAAATTTLGGGGGKARSPPPPPRPQPPLLHALWDEGPGVMLDGIPPLVSRRPVALIGTAEKRAVRVSVRARAPGGHASMPPIPFAASKKQRQGRGTDVGLSVGAALGRVLAAVDATPPPAELRAPTIDMLLAAAPHADQPLLRVLLPLALRSSSLRPLVARSLARASAGGAALARTTVVATRLQAGGQQGAGENVMPQFGEAVFNARMLPGWTRGALKGYFLRRVEEALLGAGGGAAAQVEVAVGGNEEEDEEEDESESGGVAPSDGPAFAALRGAIERCWRFEREAGGSREEEARPPIVAPALLTGMTDSRNYAALVATGGGGGGGGDGGGGILRFLPVGLSRASLARIHGTDERLDIGDLARAMCTYRVGIEALGALPPSPGGEEGGGEAEGGGGGGGGARAGGEL